MLLLKRPAQAEITIKKSRFLAEVLPVSSPAEARAVWLGRKTMYDNGGHIVYAFLTGPGAEQMGCSDDGEPSGTAGRPVLAVLKGSGLTNVILTVARWFGGIKLGTGGLVHAYTEAAQAVLAVAETGEFTLCCTAVFELSYAMYEQIRRDFAALEFAVTAESFGKTVRVEGALPEKNWPLLRAKLRDLSGGKVILSE